MPFRRRKFYGRENNQMTAVVIDGKKKALEIRENLAREIAEAKAHPVLAVVQASHKRVFCSRFFLKSYSRNSLFSFTMS